jgi:hypothetical protein
MTSGNGLLTVRILSSVILLSTLTVWIPPASAEPYLAVNEGLQCSACHTHVAGGGKRNAFGNAFAQTQMPAARIGEGDTWTGQLTSWLGIGGNLRAEYRYVDTPNQDEVSAFDIARGTLYVEATVIPDRLSVYFDQQVAPGGSLNREAYVKLKSGAGKWSLAAGQFFLPYGLRLQDDSAFVRQVTGINFNSSDRGVQAAFESGAWSTVLSVTNGSGGAAENDTGKQVSWIANYVQDRWRAGVSFNVNDSDAGDRKMQNVFFGLRTGPIAWLAEVDWISDDLPGGGDQNSLAGLVEGNWLFRRGHNLKVTYDYFDPDDNLDEDHQARYSVLWEYSPMQFVQSRVGVRIYDGIPQVDAQNREEFFLELHGHF